MRLWKWLLRLWYGKPKLKIVAPIELTRLPDGRYLVLRGHRRYAAMKQILESEGRNAEA